MASVLRSRRASDHSASGGGGLGGSSHSAKAVRYTPCNRGTDVQTDEEELEEIEVRHSDHVRSHSACARGSGRGQSGSTPSAMSITSGGISRVTNERCESAAASDVIFTTGSINGSDGRASVQIGVGGATGGGGQLTANGPKSLPGCLSAPNAASLSAPNGERTKAIGERLAGRSSSRLHVSSPCYSQRDNDNQENHQRLRRESSKESDVFEVDTSKIEAAKANKKLLKDYSHAAYDNKAHQVEPVTPKEVRKARRKEIEAKFGKKSKIELQDGSTESGEKDGCTWTFVFDPAGRFSYWWSSIVSIAFIYNFWVIIYRFAFESEEINASNLATWFTLDYCADFIYVLDIVFHFRTGYLEDGVLQTDGIKLRIHYMNSTMFYIDCLCLLPLDFLYLSIGFNSMLRCFRLVKIYRFWAFLDRTERHTNYPNLIRTVTLLHYLFAIYHWNACVMYMVTSKESNEEWHFPPESASVFTKYLHSLYWSTNVLTTIGSLPQPQTRGEYVFVIAEFVFGLLLFSAVLGNVANIVTNISAARKDFQARLDSVKTYMSLRRVPLRLQDRVIKWFDYLWLSKKSSDEDKTLNLLPDKLKAEIALHVHLDTLKRVEIFQNTEAGFLCELVLKLRPVLFSPGDYICRKGEVGKEMYIVNRGRLQVVADNGKTILATLRPGSYFGEISILNMGNEGNRRTASVRSVGYSDLFMLSKKDLWDVLKDYPTARVRLEAIAQKRVANYKKAPLEQATLPRSKSTPGLVESAGKIPLRAMFINRHNTLPSTLLSPQGSLDSNGDVSGGTGNGSASGVTTGSRISGTSGSRLSSTRTRGGGDTDDVILRASGNIGEDLTHSMTVSSITSYVTDASLPHVSMALDASRNNGFQPPLSPRPQTFAGAPVNGGTMTLIAPSAFRPVEGSTPHQFVTQGQYAQNGLNPHLLTHNNTFTNLNPLLNSQGLPNNFTGGLCPPIVNAIGASPIPFTDLSIQTTTTNPLPAQISVPSMSYLAAPSPGSGPGLLGNGPPGLQNNLPLSPAPSLSPYPTQRSFQTLHHQHPPNIATGGAISNHSNSPSFLSTGSNTLIPHVSTSPSVLPHFIGNVSPNHSSAYMSLSSRDNGQETLLAEISRLQSRLVSLEKENSTMSHKLHKQQWDVENRLSEIEMHFCGGSEGACSRRSSIDDKNLHSNRESVI